MSVIDVSRSVLGERSKMVHKSSVKRNRGISDSCDRLALARCDHISLHPVALAFVSYGIILVRVRALPTVFIEWAKIAHGIHQMG